MDLTTLIVACVIVLVGVAVMTSMAWAKANEAKKLAEVVRQTLNTVHKTAQIANVDVKRARQDIANVAARLVNAESQSARQQAINEDHASRFVAVESRVLNQPPKPIVPIPSSWNTSNKVRK